MIYRASVLLVQPIRDQRPGRFVGEETRVGVLLLRARPSALRSSHDTQGNGV